MKLQKHIYWRLQASPVKQARLYVRRMAKKLIAEQLGGEP